jgi:membrane-bound lytic murein transglycosylase D
MKRVSALALVLFSLMIGSAYSADATPGFGSNLGLQSGVREASVVGPFQVPPKLRGRVDFWKDVFAKYGRNQVVIHHREFPQVVFGVLDFSAEAETMGDAELERYKDRVEKETVLSMKQQIRQLINGEDATTSFQESFVEKMRVIPEECRSYKRVLDEDLIRTQTGIRERYAQAIGRAWKYLPVMEQIFTTEYGLPKELTRLPFIESSFDYTAYSSVGAAGIWQFMPRTARSHRMLVGRYVDERRDPVKATRGAAEYLRLAYQELGSWPLAITSYNHGVGGVRSKVRAAGTSNIAEIIEHPSERFFGFASTNFYPEFLAAVEIFQDHDKYFPEVSVQPPLRLVAYPVKSPMSTEHASRQLGVPLESLREANYALLDPVWRGATRIPAGYVLQVPVQYTDKMNQLRTPEPIRSRIVTTTSSEGTMYRVVRKDTLQSIAAKFNTSSERLMQINRLTTTSVEPGQVLLVPRNGDSQSAGSPAEAAERDAQVPEIPAVPREMSRVSQPQKSASGASSPRKHKVKGGETLSSISQRYGRSVADIKRANNLKGTRLSVGQVLRIP